MNFQMIHSPFFMVHSIKFYGGIVHAPRLNGEVLADGDLYMHRQLPTYLGGI